MEKEYTGNNCTRHFGQPYLLSDADELNILSDLMEKKIASDTQLISSIFIEATNVLMQCVSPLLI